MRPITITIEGDDMDLRATLPGLEKADAHFQLLGREFAVTYYRGDRNRDGMWSGRVELAELRPVFTGEPKP